MAGDWIKMRGALLDHPKVIAMTRTLREQKAFREWLTPGGSGAMNDQVVSDAASRAVTTALLLRAWSSAREHGKFAGDDLWLEHSWVEDLDQLAGAPGVGLAMQAVGWVVNHPTDKGIILPNFKEFNVPMTEAERAQGYRDRKKNVTNESRTPRDENPKNVTPRVEKSREEKEQPQGGEKAVLPTWVPLAAWNGYVEMRAKIRKPLTERAKALAIGKLEGLRAEGYDPELVLNEAVEKSWQGIYKPKSGASTGDQFAGAL